MAIGALYKIAFQGFTISIAQSFWLDEAEDFYIPDLGPTWGYLPEDLWSL